MQERHAQQEEQLARAVATRPAKVYCSKTLIFMAGLQRLGYN